jgi:hypothetical protein
VPVLQAQQCPGMQEVLNLEQGPEFADRFANAFYTGAIWGISTIISKDSQAILSPIFKRASYKAFEPKSVSEELLANFAKRCNKPKMDAYAAIIQTDPYKSLMKLQTVTQRPDFPAQLQTFWQGLAKHRPSDARMALITRYDKAVLSTDCVMTVFDAGNKALQQTVGLSGLGNIGDLQDIRERMWQQVNLINVYVFRDTSDTDLLAYVKLVEQPPAHWFHTTYAAALADVMRSRMTVAVRLIMEQIRNPESASR